MHTRELTQTAILPCEGICGPRATRHHFIRARANPTARHRLLELIYSCRICERERVWGVVEPAVLQPIN